MSGQHLHGPDLSAPDPLFSVLRRAFREWRGRRALRRLLAEMPEERRADVLPDYAPRRRR